MSDFSFEHPLERDGEEIVVTVTGRYSGGARSYDWYQPDDEPECEVESITIDGRDVEVTPAERKAIADAAWNEGGAQAAIDRDEAAVRRWESSHDSY